MRDFLKKTKQTSDTFRLNLLLSVIGGFTDAHTFIERGNVLANAQTGNIVYFSLNLVERKWERVIAYFFPISIFVIGILTAEYVKKNFRTNNKLHWRQRILLLEIIVLTIAAFVPSQEELNIFVNVSISFVASLQFQAFRKTKGNIAATTMCTGNLRSGSEQLFNYLATKDKKSHHAFLVYYGLIVFFIIGTIIGAFFTELFHERSLLICVSFLLVAFLIMFKEEI